MGRVRDLILRRKTSGQILSITAKCGLVKGPSWIFKHSSLQGLAQAQRKPTHPSTRRALKWPQKEGVRQTRRQTNRYRKRQTQRKVWDGGIWQTDRCEDKGRERTRSGCIGLSFPCGLNMWHHWRRAGYWGKKGVAQLSLCLPEQKATQNFECVILESYRHLGTNQKGAQSK